MTRHLTHLLPIGTWFLWLLHEPTAPSYILLFLCFYFEISATIRLSFSTSFKSPTYCGLWSYHRVSLLVQFGLAIILMDVLCIVVDDRSVYGARSSPLGGDFSTNYFSWASIIHWSWLGFPLTRHRTHRSKGGEGARLIHRHGSLREISEMY
jgi:hypothetical protein